MSLEKLLNARSVAVVGASRDERKRGFQAIKALIELCDGINLDLEKHRPWHRLKEGRSAEAREVITRGLAGLHRAGYWLGPFLPAASSRILEALAARPIRPQGTLFPRIA